jgi:hypothetical protein
LTYLLFELAFYLTLASHVVKVTLKLHEENEGLNEGWVVVGMIKIGIPIYGKSKN